MICSKCGYINKTDSRFCIKCGQKLEVQVFNNLSISTNLSTGALLQNRYKIIREIGKGGMGMVYLASDNRFSNRICVVKELLGYFTNESEDEKQKAIERFNKEADLLAEINHANVPQVYDRFSEGRRYYLVMEFIRGIDLNVLLDEYFKIYNSPLPEKEVVSYFIQLCHILNYLHNQEPPILHRDIKPSNILLTKEGRIKLVDFGIAKTIQKKNAGTSIGTQGYAAPEQYRGFAEERTDIYALGATIHHLLTGQDPQFQTPFDFPKVNEINPSINKDLSIIIERMLQNNIEDRPKNMEAVINAIKRIYKEIEETPFNYSIKDNIFNIIDSKTEVKIDSLSKNICSSCKHFNNSSSKFCIKCGNKLER